MNYDILKIDPLSRVSLKVRHLTVSVNNKKVKDDESHINNNIIEDVSFDLGSGELLAILGGSGSGKTTLLNILSQKLNINNKRLQFNGSVNYYIGNEPTGKTHIKNSFLMQTDTFSPGLTTWEYLNYQADLRLPGKTKQAKTHLIMSLLDILEIEHLKNTTIMTFSKKINLSGGERRRVSLCVQLLNKPSILFLDEPTTGLDSSSSFKLIQVLRKLSSSDLGVSIILSIHQPRPEISILFDKICLLTRGGRLVYYGNLANSVPYFNGLNLLPSELHFSKMINFIMDLSVKDTSSKLKEQIAIEKIDKLVSNWKLNQTNLEPIQSPASFKSNLKLFQTPRSQKISLLTEVMVLTKRTFILTYRDYLSLMSLVGLAIALAVIDGWMFFKPPADLAGIRSYTSSVYVMLEILGFMPLFIEMERLWENDGVLFFREYKENYVSIPGFIISRKLGKLLLEDIPVTFSFTFITYFMFGLRTSETTDGPFTMHYFFVYLAIGLLVYFISMGSALLCFAWAPNFAATAMIQNVFYQLQNSACGYFVNASTMPVYVRWIKYISYFWYAFGALAANQYTGWMGDCPYEDEARCLEYSGDYQLQVLGFPTNWISEPLWILFAWIFGFYIMAALGLKFRNYDMSLGKVKKNRIDDVDDSDTDNSDAFSSKEVEAKVNVSEFDNELNEDINIQLHNISLIALPKRFAFKPQPFQILNSITSNFEANKVNVIMGPSGSGKTTLLNLISNRLPKSTRFQLTGEVKINNHQSIKISSLSKISGYVTQFDNSLIPHLTVRETLYYQAKLRLDTKDHPRIPTIINTLIREIGLVDCANMVIGNDDIKGISGGEKRRVSIGIQLLSKPKILFLDEPTSGLDSATSQSILGLLDKLTKENGTTIITTIHQPSEQMFKSFGSMLLLAKGGNVVYNGPSDSIEEYLARIGFVKPENGNIADYILDIISQGIDESKEAVKVKVDDLVYQWKSKGRVDFMTGNTINVNAFKLRKRPFITRFKTIFERQALCSIRSKDAIMTRAFQILALGVVHALFFSPLKNTQQGISNRLGLIQEVLNFYFIGLINNFAIFPIERDLFYQEFKDGLYTNFEFQSIYFIIESIIEIVTCLIFSAFVVFVVGLPRNAATYFSMFLSCFISVNVGESLGIFINCLLDHLGLAINLLSNLMVVAIFMGGTMSLHMPEFFKAFNYLNPLKYAVGICARLSFKDQSFTCASETGCTLNTGQKVLEYYQLDIYLPGYFGGLVTCFIVYRLLAYVCCEIRIRYFL